MHRGNLLKRENTSINPVQGYYMAVYFPEELSVLPQNLVVSQRLSEYSVSGEHHKEKKNHHTFESFMDVESRSVC